jgi:hypothetical protein
LPDGPPAPAKPRPTVTLFEECEPNAEALRRVVLRHLPPGTPIDQARSALEGQGFSCRADDTKPLLLLNTVELIPREVYVSFAVRERLRRVKDCRPVYCVATLRGAQEWHLHSYRVLVVLVPDVAQTVQDVEVGVGPLSQSSSEAFVEARPGLHEPVGMPVEEARARMAAAGFRCSGVEPGGADGDPRPHVRCEAYNENPLWGNIVRVSLYPDEAGVVREVKLLPDGGVADTVRCMLPHDDDTPAWAVCKTALFPVRVGLDVALFSAALFMAITAFPYGLK